MGTMIFPGEIPDGEKLYSRVDGSLTVRCTSKKHPEIVTELHYRGREGSPLMSCQYFRDYPDRANREDVYYDGASGKEKPYLRRVYEDNRLILEQGLRGQIGKLRYEEKYIYEDGETVPSKTLHEDFDEKGNSLSQKSLKNIFKRKRDPDLNDVSLWR